MFDQDVKSTSRRKMTVGEWHWPGRGIISESLGTHTDTFTVKLKKVTASKFSIQNMRKSLLTHTFVDINILCWCIDASK